MDEEQPAGVSAESAGGAVGETEGGEEQSCLMVTGDEVTTLSQPPVKYDY